MRWAIEPGVATLAEVSGPVLVVELLGPVPASKMARLRESVLRVSSRFEERRSGEYDVHVSAERLGVEGLVRPEDGRPFLVSVMGPGVGDEETFAAEHEDEPDMEPLIGFIPTHCVDVIAFCNSDVDHCVTALLTAEVMDVLGGFAYIELREDQEDIVAGLPGLIARVPHDPYRRVFGTAEFLRGWVHRPGFRLLK